MRSLLWIAAAALAACSPQPGAAPETSTAERPVIVACNELQPDLTHMVTVQDEATVALGAGNLLGGRITPGEYDLVRAVRVGSATGWRGERAVVIGVSESEAGTVLNWAGSARLGDKDTWTATLTDQERPRISFTCGRIGDADTTYRAQSDALTLRIEDGASGVLHMEFERRR